MNTIAVMDGLRKRFPRDDEYLRAIKGLLSAFLIYSDSILVPVSRTETIEDRWQDARQKLAKAMKATKDLSEGRS